MRLPLFALLSFVLSGMPWHAISASEPLRWEVVSESIDGRLVAESIGEVVGEADETLESVLHRAGRRLVEYSKKTGFEACGEICTSESGPSRFGLRLTTVKAHLGCPVLPVCPSGFVPGQGNIHSHGSSRPYRVNRADAALSHFEVGEVQRVPHNHFQFSTEDLSGTDGVWLARPDGLLFASRSGEGLRFIPSPEASAQVASAP